MGADKRRNERFAAHLKVRYGTALDFVVEYADNLSVGGLFVRGGHRLEPLSDVEVELDLPGYQTFKVRGRVAHLVSPELAAKTGRRPGAGVEITERPDGFDRALTEYLRRLGRRRDVSVLAESGVPFTLMSAAGFLAAELPLPHALLGTMSSSERPVLAVVITRSRESEYRLSVDKAGIADLLHVLDHEEELDDLLTSLDALL